MQRPVAYGFAIGILLAGSSFGAGIRISRIPSL
jgi:hypothetical protein